MSYRLKIDIQSYWHAGTGRGQGSDVDALAHRDKDGIPCLPGRTVKGLLRDALSRWTELVGDSVSDESVLVRRLFGQSPEEAEATFSTDERKAPMAGFGLLRVSDAVLRDDELFYLKDNKDLASGLFRSLHATKINPETGTAEDQSLRGMEVVIPLTLYADVIEVPGVAAVENWAEKLRQALLLIQAVGAHRTRGLGRAVVTLEEVA